MSKGDELHEALKRGMNKTAQTSADLKRILEKTEHSDVVAESTGNLDDQDVKKTEQNNGVAESIGRLVDQGFAQFMESAPAINEQLEDIRSPLKDPISNVLSTTDFSELSETASETASEWAPTVNFLRQPLAGPIESGVSGFFGGLADYGDSSGQS